MLRLAALGAAAALGASLVGEAQARPGGGIKPISQFSACGYVIEGVECPLFKADSGGVYIVGGLSAWAGQHIRVKGTYDPGCISYCQQGNGCVFNATITLCDEGTSTRSLEFDVQEIVPLLNEWSSCDGRDSCQWDINRDGAVNVSDLVVMMDNLR